MAGDRYFITDQKASHFLTLTVVHWIDIYTRVEYRDIIVDSLNYCIKAKGLKLNAWVIMSNHLHLVGRVESDIGMSGFLRDFKKYTSKRIIRSIKEIPESRREWLLDKFAFEARRSGRASNYKFWKDDNHAIDLTNGKIDISQKINYVHDNPVHAGWVDEPDHYNYSSARDYNGMKGLVNIEVL